MNLPDEVLSNLQLQKEYVYMEMEGKFLQMIFCLALGLGVIILCTGFIYHYWGYIATFVFLALSLIVLATIAYHRHRKLTNIKLAKLKEIQLSNTRLHNHWKEMASPPDMLLSISQAIRIIFNIINEVKFLFKEKDIS